MFLNAAGAEEFAEERKGQHFSASFAKTSDASSALRLALNNQTSSVLTQPRCPRLLPFALPPALHISCRTFKYPWLLLLQICFAAFV